MRGVSLVMTPLPMPTMKRKILHIRDTYLEKLFDRACDADAHTFDGLHSIGVSALIERLIASGNDVSAHDLLQVLRYLREYERCLIAIEHEAGKYRKEPDL